MITFQEQVRQIYVALANGNITLVTAIVQFESLMRCYGYMPESVELGRDISRDNMFALLRQAQTLPEAGKNPCAEVDLGAGWQKDGCTCVPCRSGAPERHQDYQPSMLLCPVCGTPSPNLYSEVALSTEIDNTSTQEKLDPPRCQACVDTWIEENVFKTKRRYIPDTVMSSMSLTEFKFFSPYEDEMTEFNKSSKSGKKSIE